MSLKKITDIQAASDAIFGSPYLGPTANGKLIEFDLDCPLCGDYQHGRKPDSSKICDKCRTQPSGGDAA